MIYEKKNKPEKQLSTAKSILAVLWLVKGAGKNKIFSHKYIKLFCRDKNKATYRSCISRLCKNNLIKKDLNDVIVLTDKGRKQALLAFIEAELNLHKKESQWDGGWRIVFFDIPEEKRSYRDYIRKILKKVGFQEFQRSIWIYPYPVPGFLKELLFEENIKPHVRFITTQLVDDDSDLRKTFNLPLKIWT